MEIVWLMVPGFVVGVLVFDSFRKIFSDDSTVVRRLLADQPVTMATTATTIGTVLIWAALRVIGVL